ncbi:hypothetical protein SISNIDRAFT_431860 [Sistotremastrum niveocremeum HHB9708]|uniref:Uncharacterized protein n=1 Tax=Sistotremastrum niveocremeum HHB9708 TaxID=1314777 RepID=A0A164Q3K0_9AGAM|nr:hypothetical protein SISNIDRAFT_431860 [Sistotremastrum niveocremeum HHB9708]
MSAVRNHRVLIASLFLPVTASFQDENIPPVISPTVTAEPGPLFRVPDPLPESSTPTKKTPKSILDDLKVKISTPLQTPGLSENSNPFGDLKSNSSFLADSLAKSVQRRTSSAATSRPLRRVSRRNSRSSSLHRGPPTPTASTGWHFDSNPNGNGGLYNAVHSVDDKLRSKLWIGALGQPTDSFDTELRRGLDRRLWDEHDSLAVWIPDHEFSGCYDTFCHQVLWPCLHYAIPDAPKTKIFYESNSFEQYKAVNQRFADAIVNTYEEGDIIWVNDYHLMLVPQMVRQKLPTAIVGFFLHVAFPSSEIFRCLAVRQELLMGMLASDLIGFQTANFARHFRQTVSRILSFEALPKGIQLENAFVDVAVFAMGIDVKSLTKKRKQPEVADWVKLLRQRYGGMKLVVGRDKLDEVQGVRHKLLAFEAFLEKYPEFQGKAVLIQVALMTSETNEEHGSVSDVVSRINSRFSNLTYQPIVFLHTHELTFSQYLALLTVADAFLVTSLREGMALRTHEFVECQEGRARPLILSEFTGSYSYSGFRSCIAINPWDKRATAQAINQALTMSDEEALSRWKDLHSHVITQTAQTFVTSFLTRCLRVHLEHQQRDPLSIPSLDVSLILPRYKHSQNRLILVDLEGTLWQRNPAMRDGGFQPPQEALDVLKRLSDDDRNNVWLLSGLPVGGGLDKIAAALPNVGLCAENGCFIKPLPLNGKPQDWINMVSNFNLTWKTPCLEILNYFTERTPNSFIEEREASIVWRFWMGDSKDDKDGRQRQWARRQAAEAQNHVFDSLGERYGLRIIPGENSFLVLHNNVSRSSAVGAILHPGGPVQTATSRPSAWAEDIAEGVDVNEIDFVLAVSGDEKLLRRLNDLDHAETCSTRGKGSDAKWRLEPKDVVSTLLEFAGANPSSPV